jgi:hypothetical protein
MLTSSQMITANVQAYAIIQQDDNINVMTWLVGNITIVTGNYMWLDDHIDVIIGLDGNIAVKMLYYQIDG